MHNVIFFPIGPCGQKRATDSRPSVQKGATSSSPGDKTGTTCQFPGLQRRQAHESPIHAKPIAYPGERVGKPYAHDECRDGE